MSAVIEYAIRIAAGAAMVPLFAAIFAILAGAMYVAFLIFDYIGCLFEWDFMMDIAATCVESGISIGGMSSMFGFFGGIIGIGAGLRVIFVGKWPWDT